MPSVVCDRISLHRGKIVALSCVVASWLASAATASAAVINVVPLATDVTAGQTFDVEFEVIGAIDLYEFQFSIFFDKTVLTFVEGDAIEGPFLSEGGTVSTFFGSNYDQLDPDTAPASVFISSIRDGASSGVSGDGTLVRASFTVAEGATFGLTSISAVFFNGFPTTDGLWDSTALNNMIDFGEEDRYVAEATVTVAPPTSVPEPGTFLLLSTGFAASVVASRRRHRLPKNSV
jgi:hypothetical protein